ncbi:uncharacterized protein DEA37_0000937 [Paragonimus westermani]|uniref:Uncharacterized protein n=1 Tax=Paragonimus westermani TaxID=34504 RepID=A0A5J4NVN8_9TREM|nr:uncharacterized protein DEA37_0000937 [Paragonimus westermani]
MSPPFLKKTATGNRLAVALGNGVCLLLRCASRKCTDQFHCKPLLGLPSGDTLSGHKGPVLCASWSSDGRLLVTGSADRVARMWVLGENPTVRQRKGPKPGPRTTLVMDSINGGSTNCFGVCAGLQSATIKVHTPVLLFGVASNGVLRSFEVTFENPIEWMSTIRRVTNLRPISPLTDVTDSFESKQVNHSLYFTFLPTRCFSAQNDKNTKDGNSFPDCIQFAHFHYLDSFVYLHKPVFYRVSFNRGPATSLYKLAGNFAINSCNRITAISSVNIFYSFVSMATDLLISAGSDRRLSVLDLNAGRVVEETESAHTRNITAITLNQGSMFSSPVETDDPLSASSGNLSESYSTFATVAPGDCARMWDLRDTTHPVLQFSNPDVTTASHTSLGASLDPLVPPVNASFSPCGRQLVVGGRLIPNQLYPVIYDTRRPGSHPLATLSPNTNKAQSAPTTVVAWHPLRPEVFTRGPSTFVTK